MTRLQRGVWWTLAAYWAASLGLVLLVVYDDVAPPLRAVYAATVAAYGIPALLSLRARPADPRVRVLVWFNGIVTATWWIYPLAPHAPATLAATLYLLLYESVFFATSALLLHVGAVLPERGPLVRRRPEIIRAGYVTAALATILAVSLAVNARTHTAAGLPATFDAARQAIRTAVLALYGVSSLLGSALVLDAALAATSVAARRQAAALGMALFPFGVFRLCDAAFPAVSRMPAYPTIEAIALFILPLCCFLAIHGFRLFDGGWYLRRGLVLGVTLALLTACAAVIALTARAVLPDVIDSPQGFVLACVAAGVLLVPAARHIGALLDTVLFPERVALRGLTAGILRNVAVHTDVRGLCGAFAASLCEHLGLRSAAVYVVDEVGEWLELAGAAGADGSAPDRVRTAQAAELAARKVGFAGFRCLVPVALGERINALLALGPTVAGEALGAQELREVETAALQVSAMIENARLFALATRDSLTGLVRRAVFEEQLRSEIARFSRGQVPFSVLLADIDDFKQVNDRYGHGIGDEVLRAVSAAMRSAVRESDTVARYGGEELAVLLPDTAADGAATVGEKVRVAVAALSIRTCERMTSVTVSIGAATMEPGLDAVRLVERADDALYRAKARGKNRVELHIPSLAGQAQPPVSVG